MANNFKLAPAGAIYISKEGNDANAGTADLPKATLLSSTTQVVGAGVYKGAFSLGSSANNFNLFADGTVVLSLTANAVFAGGIYTFGFYKYDTRLQLNGFNIYYNGVGAVSNNCVYENGSITATANTAITMTSCILNGITASNFDTTGGLGFLYSKFFNCEFVINTGTSYVAFQNSYVDYSTIISWNTYTLFTSQFFNNCFNGKIVIGTSVYELKKDKSGTLIPDRIGNGVLDLETIDATVYTRKNFSQDPEFLNISKRDYWSVSSTSPLLFAASNPLNNIGNVRYSVVKKVTDAEFIGGTITDLATIANDYVLQTPATSGQVVTLPIQIAPIPQVLDTLNFARPLNFNSDITLGDAENNNVVINQNYADGTAGANPRRLTYEMRWSNQSTQPTLDAHWDNNGYGTAGNYFLFEQDSIPKVSFDGVSAFYGNGSPEYDVLVGGKISAKWVQFRIKLLNGIG